jgi:hypothetical protein
MTHFETLLQDDKEDQVHNQVYVQVRRQSSNQVYVHLEDQVYNQTQRLIEIQVATQAWWQVSEELHDPL